MLEQISKDRGVSVDDLNKNGQYLSHPFPEDAVGKLIDGLYMRRSVSDNKKKINLDENKN